MIFRGRIKNGRVVLDSPSTMPDGTEVEIRPAKKAKSRKTSRTTRPKARPRSLLERLANCVGKAKGLPPDASINHDYYLYGAPKRK